MIKDNYDINMCVSIAYIYIRGCNHKSPLDYLSARQNEIENIVDNDSEDNNNKAPTSVV